MAGKKSSLATGGERPLIHFSFPRLALFTVSVIAGTAAVVYVTYCFGLQSGIIVRARSDWFAPANPASAEAKPWGELVLQDIILESPSNYDEVVPRPVSVPGRKVVMAHLQVYADSDIDKLLGYWAASANGVRYKDLRPLLEAIKRKPGGGGVNILYLLPPFARERLNAFPVATGGAPRKTDCQWGTFNFFNDPPDDHFYDGAYLNKYLQDNYYQVAAPSLYGDIVLVLDGNNNILQSGVQIADDVVFTKTGAEYAAPWTLMHLKDLLAIYASTPKVHFAVWRNNTT